MLSSIPFRLLSFRYLDIQIRENLNILSLTRIRSHAKDRVSCSAKIVRQDLHYRVARMRTGRFKYSPRRDCVVSPLDADELMPSVFTFSPLLARISGPHRRSNQKVNGNRRFCLVDNAREPRIESFAKFCTRHSFRICCNFAKFAFIRHISFIPL